MARFRSAAMLIGCYALLCAPLLATRQLNDELGRNVAAPDDPQRVVCLAPSLTETVYALGRGYAVVGVTDFTDYPPEAKSKPNVGGLDDASLEKIVSLRPDLVLAMGTLNREQLVLDLTRLGIPVYVVDPQGLMGILASILHVGDALNCRGDAQRLVARLDGQRATVAQLVSGLPRLKVLVVVWYDPVITAGNKSFITDVIAAAGAQSVTADIPQAWPQISLEEVLRRPPDVLLLVRSGHGGITIDELKGHAGWDRLAAVRDNRVIYMNDRFFHPSPMVFDALQQLAQQLHPGAFLGGH